MAHTRSARDETHDQPDDHGGDHGIGRATAKRTTARRSARSTSPPWGAAVLGIALGLVVLVAFLQALS